MYVYVHMEPTIYSCCLPFTRYLKGIFQLAMFDYRSVSWKYILAAIQQVLSYRRVKYVVSQMWVLLETC